jgi:uncharacterized phiE125 gp8 family phage protein
MLTSRTVAPATEPVTLTEAKAHLYVDGTADDTLITALIVAAREQAELFTRRSFVTQTWQALLDNFPVGGINLPYGPLASVSSIAYLDDNGDSQTLSTDVYAVDTVGQRVHLKYDQVWPTTRNIENAITITYVTGYTVVPQSIKAAVLLLVGEMFKNREESGPSNIAQLPLTAERLLWPYRDLRF